MAEDFRCSTEWTSPRSGQPMRCDLADGHGGECRSAGFWRDDDERANARLREAVRAASLEKRQGGE